MSIVNNKSNVKDINTNAFEVNKKDLTVLNKMDIRVVPFDYIAKPKENVFQAYIFENIPIMLASKTINKEKFRNMVEEIL